MIDRLMNLKNDNTLNICLKNKINKILLSLFISASILKCFKYSKSKIIVYIKFRIIQNPFCMIAWSFYHITEVYQSFRMLKININTYYAVHINKHKDCNLHRNRLERLLIANISAVYTSVEENLIVKHTCNILIILHFISWQNT